ncbi:ATP-binding cassette domain-containing protein [Microbaculum sp. FT89]|uniref:ATP-binding cassette domain-containing protein n=1 Tax=Microbaculum sp. FT89 TaxID=3447298 RepID=UPI003F52BBF6
MESRPILEAVDISVRFGGVVAVDGVSLTIAPGQIYCIVGPNGAGKSTFFNVLTGTVRPSTGRILIDGREFAGRPVHAFARSGVARKFQAPSVFPSLTVGDNLRVAQRDRQDEHAIAEILTLLGMAELAGIEASTLGHGQRQWLEIGMALATKPRLLLLDEPTAGMGPDETQRTVSLIRRISESAAVIVIEHDMEFVRSLAVHTMVLHQGRLISQGSFEDVAEDEFVRDVYLGRR